MLPGAGDISRHTRSAQKAMMMLAVAPAADTRINPLRLCGAGMFSRLTGTGLAHPKPTTKSISDPMGSMCLIGLSVSLPSHLAVSSPIL